MGKKKINFDKLMDVINYYNVQRDFITVGEDGKFHGFDFRKFDEMGIDESNCPYNFKEFLEYNIKLDKIVLIAEDHDEPVYYWFNADENSIVVNSDKFTMKEALTVINLVMKYQMLNKKKCHEICIGRNIDKEIDVFSQESTEFGCWWNDFIELFQNNIENINVIAIYFDEHLGVILEMKEENN